MLLGKPLPIPRPIVVALVEIIEGGGGDDVGIQSNVVPTAPLPNLLRQSRINSLNPENPRESAS